MSKSYLGLGTNIGDRIRYIHEALKILNSNPNINITKKSKLYETKAWGYKDQADFLNMCIEIETSLNPYELLNACQGVEKDLNRERKIRWGPRTIDVDILSIFSLSFKSISGINTNALSFILGDRKSVV